MLTNDFPGRSVVSWYNSVEQMLEEVLSIVPYEPNHLEVWSPRLTTVLLETCSQLDSLWKHEALLLDYTKKRKNLTIKNYFNYFGQYLAPRWLVFWGETPTQIHPFGPWRSVESFEEKEYDSYPLLWWRAYNDLKHSRIDNRRESKLKWAVEAAAGLFLAILRCEPCRTFVSDAGWLQSTSHNAKVALEEDTNDTSFMSVCAETRLFSYPVSFWRVPWKRRGLRWTGSASERFRSWFEEFEIVYQGRTVK